MGEETRPTARYAVAHSRLLPHTTPHSSHHGEPRHARATLLSRLHGMGCSCTACLRRAVHPAQWQAVSKHMHADCVLACERRGQSLPLCARPPARASHALCLPLRAASDPPSALLALHELPLTRASFCGWACGQVNVYKSARRVWVRTTRWVARGERGRAHTPERGRTVQQTGRVRTHGGGTGGERNDK